MKKRIISLCLILALALSLFVFSASAAEVSRGNGYEMIPFKYNGKNYSAVLTARYNSSSGACTQISTEAAVKANLGAPKVEFNTRSYGHITDIGSSTSGQLTENVNAISTKWVKCRYGMNQVINCMSIYGTGAVIANDQTYSSSVFMTP